MSSFLQVLRGSVFFLHQSLGRPLLCISGSRNPYQKRAEVLEVKEKGRTESHAWVVVVFKEV